MPPVSTTSRPAWHTKLTVGQCYFFQTCTKDWVGRVVSIDGPYTVVLEEASWVADSGRLHVFVKEGRADNMEIEPVGIQCIQWLNWGPWLHPLFMETVPS